MSNPLNLLLNRNYVTIFPYFKLFYANFYNPNPLLFTPISEHAHSFYKEAGYNTRDTKLSPHNYNPKSLCESALLVSDYISSRTPITYNKVILPSKYLYVPNGFLLKTNISFLLPQLYYTNAPKSNFVKPYFPIIPISDVISSFVDFSINPTNFRFGQFFHTNNLPFNHSAYKSILLRAVVPIDFCNHSLSSLTLNRSNTLNRFLGDEYAIMHVPTVYIKTIIPSSKLNNIRHNPILSDLLISVSKIYPSLKPYNNPLSKINFIRM